tara:strand:+ start:942 stop:1274 length:333 start_codon:yes stop_codon:yes gene_type:complete
MEKGVLREIKMGLTISDLIREIVKDWKEEVRYYSDEKLLEDRSYWMKNYGYEYGFDYDDERDREEDTLDSDLHTLSIELEQIRRFGEIIYRMPDGKMKFKKKEKNRITER